MSGLPKTCVSLMLLTSVGMAAEPETGRGELYPDLRSYLEQRMWEFDQIPADRQMRLNEIAVYVKNRRQANEPARLMFICTHNSRRSHMSQIWAGTAAFHYGVSGVESYSGGTEATAFNPRAVAAIERTGMKAQKNDDSKNPRYAIRFRDGDQPMVCFSKVYSEDPNPKKDFCAIMTCAAADENCPFVKGCTLRVAIPYDDPKASDNTPEEVETYDERCRQICREMFYLFAQVRN